MANRYFVLSEMEIKQLQNIRQQSVSLSTREDIQEKLIIKSKDFQILGSFTKSWYPGDASSKKHRLGIFHKATLNKQSVLCRVITFERMTSYILEDYFNEVSRLKQLKMKSYILPILGYNIKDTTLTIFQNESMSLYEVLHSTEKEEVRKQTLDKREKYSISLQVAKIMATFHQFTPPICHGHLTSHNIMLEVQPGTKRYLVKIADLELHPLHKFANTFSDYRNASVWSSPECLQNQRKLSDQHPEMDIYSFGMLMWELWHQTVPFDGDLAMCQQYVMHEDSRPMIETEGGEDQGHSVDSDMAKLIRLCWQSAPEKRPKFVGVCKLLLQSIQPNA